MKAINEATINFPSRSANESYARTVVSAFATQLDPTLEEIGDIKTAVSEAVTNAIVHAYPNCLGKIYIRLRIYDNNTLEIVVKDKGLGISDIEKAKTPMYTTGGNDRSGMGFTIMESFTDSLKINSKPGKGTTVTMRKKISVRIGGNLRDRDL